MEDSQIMNELIWLKKTLFCVQTKTFPYTRILFSIFQKQNTNHAIKKAANSAFKTIQQHLTQLLYSLQELLSRILHLQNVYKL